MLQHTAENLPEIRIHNLTLVCRYDVVEAASLVHTESQRAVLFLIAEGELHLIAVLQLSRAALHAFKYIGGCNRAVQKFLKLPFF